MSVEAYTWALNLAPVPMDASDRVRKGRETPPPPKPNSACAFVLVGLANHADPDGTNAFPGVDTLVRYTRLSERTVRTALDRLEAEGIIRPSDPEILAAKIKRGDRRPNGYDLNFDMMRNDLTGAELDKIGKDNPWLRPWIEQNRRSQMLSNAPDSRGAATAPRDERGAATAGNGVQPLPERGAAAAPEPYLNRPTEPSITASSSDADADALFPDPPAPKRPKQRSQFPADWEPSPELIAWAAENAPSVADHHAEFIRCRDHHRAKGTPFKDHDLAAKNWMKNAAEWQSRRAARPRQGDVNRAWDEGDSGWDTAAQRG